VRKLGAGTFSQIFEAHDRLLNKRVALKIEKKDKSKDILLFEYNVLQALKGLKHVCQVYDYVKNPE
jgi:predicted Ser/Thr protein kinase